LGIDSFKEKITKETMSFPHIELIFLVDLKNNKKYWTGKSYPWVGQNRGLVRISNLNTHFIDIKEIGKIMIMGCHDLSIFNPRSKNAKGDRRKINKDFIKITKKIKPDIVLHHPHTTVMMRTWLNGWNGLKKIMPSVKYISSGKYYEDDRPKSKWDSLITILNKTKNGNSIDVIVK
jgi:hypothetical protein